MKRVLIACMGKYENQLVKDTLYYFNEKNVELNLIFIVESLSPMLKNPILREEIRKELLEEGKLILNEVADKFNKEGKNINMILREGDPAEEIIKYAEDRNIDIIVVGSNKKTIDKHLLGSVTEDIVHSTPCTVLLLKTELEEEK
ncbi:MAG: universal stress protein [Methanobacteriaceae archaeon]|nr:universal stress protein [Methanobacteriaceae archaeon]